MSGGVSCAFSLDDVVQLLGYEALDVRRRPDGMKLPPPVNLPEGGTPAERLDMAFRKVLTVPKETLLREEAKGKRQRVKRRSGKKAH
jgi:hypothetical protein